MFHGAEWLLKNFSLALPEFIFFGNLLIWTVLMNHYEGDFLKKKVQCNHLLVAQSYQNISPTFMQRLA